jgi:hypothetical protein
VLGQGGFHESNVWSDCLNSLSSHHASDFWRIWVLENCKKSLGGVKKYDLDGGPSKKCV